MGGVCGAGSERASVRHVRAEACAPQPKRKSAPAPSLIYAGVDGDSVGAPSAWFLRTPGASGKAEKTGTASRRAQAATCHLRNVPHELHLPRRTRFPTHPNRRESRFGTKMLLTFNRESTALGIFGTLFPSPYPSTSLRAGGLG